MPTPSPIIDTSSGVIVLMSVRPARMKRSRNAVMSATIASASGIAVATSVRKTTSSTMSAASRPRSSCVPCSIGGNSASPLNSTTTPTAATPSRTASWTASTGLAILVVDDAVELCLCVRDSTVLGEGVLAEGVSDALDARALVRSDRLRTRTFSAWRSPPRSRPSAPAARRVARLRARRTRGSARRPARRRTRPRSGPLPSASRSPGSRTRPSSSRRPSPRGR